MSRCLSSKSNMLCRMLGTFAASQKASVVTNLLALRRLASSLLKKKLVPSRPRFCRCCEVGNGYCRLIATTDLTNYCVQEPYLYIRPARPFASIRLQLGLNQAPDRQSGSYINALESTTLPPVPKRWRSIHNSRLRATVYKIVNFPVPAILLIQQIGLPLRLSAQLAMSLSSLIRVPCKHSVFCPSSYESKAAPLATGSRLKSNLLCRVLREALNSRLSSSSLRASLSQLIIC